MILLLKDKAKTKIELSTKNYFITQIKYKMYYVKAKAAFRGVETGFWRFY